ncbi:hypothetical protein MKK84_24690 [Methylobacterium sp. E-065]|uniref:hypothetical protein n=1 Tax=Methylobacterium sp. E-065 TaxID=2836583 RepID=UPI001FB9B662|nr:hypothetical protein [Methylobacterium sp. E-065]MCJ2020587.1 hypothetical protein [Methylobacterium sp. E-065]
MAERDSTSPVIARTWAVEKARDATGRDIVRLRLLGEGFSLPPVELTPALAASLSGRLGLLVADMLAETERRR